MRVAGLLLLVVLGRGAEAPVPLDEGGAGVLQVRNALAALARGDAAPLRGLPGERWQMPPGLPDPQDPLLIRRWTDLLPVALRHLDGESRRAIEAQIPGVRAVPQAWERGDLLPVVAAGEPARRAAAARLLGWSEPAEPPLDLPGPVVPGGGPAHMAPVLFHRLGSRLLGVDGLGGTVWQRPLEQHAQVFLGGPWTAIRGRGGVVVVATDGRLFPVPAVPPQAVLQGVAGAGVWFAAGAKVWGFDPASSRQVAGVLGGEPLGPPLARGLTSWWLTSADITVVGPEGRIPVEHGLRLSSGARLAWMTDGPGIIDGDRQWRILASGASGGWGSPAGTWAQGLPPGLWCSDDDPPWRPPGAWWHRRRIVSPPVAGQGMRLGDGSWRVGDRTFTCERGEGITTVQARDPAGEVWSRAWPAPTLDQAPGSSLAVVRGLVVVTEGDRATVLDAGTGRRWAAVQAPGLDPLACAALPDGLVAWPIGLGDRLRWVRGQESGEIPLAAPLAGWRVVAGRLWAQEADGPGRPVP